MLFKAVTNPKFDVRTVVRPVGEIVAPLKLILWAKEGAGKTTTAVRVARGLIASMEEAGRIRANGKVVVVDTEDLAAKALKQFPDVHAMVPRDMLNVALRATEGPMGESDPRILAHAVALLGEIYEVVIIDTVSPAWQATNALVDAVAASHFRKRRDGDPTDAAIRANKAAAWSWGSPIWDDFVSAVRRCPAHVICLARGKVLRDMTNPGRTLGAAPIVRREFLYEVDHHGQVVLAEDGQRSVVFGKGRHQFDGATLPADETLGAALAGWLTAGASEVGASVRTGPAADFDPDFGASEEILGITVGDG